LAKSAVEHRPEQASYWNTLGVAYYRAGNWTDGAAALRKSIELGKRGGSSNWFFRAMAHWKLGERDEARRCYEGAVEWEEKNKTGDEALRRFRLEAAELIGVAKKPD